MAPAYTSAPINDSIEDIDPLDLLAEMKSKESKKAEKVYFINLFFILHSKKTRKIFFRKENTRKTKPKNAVLNAKN